MRPRTNHRELICLALDAAAIETTIRLELMVRRRRKGTTVRGRAVPTERRQSADCCGVSTSLTSPLLVDVAVQLVKEAVHHRRERDAGDQDHGEP